LLDLGLQYREVVEELGDDSKVDFILSELVEKDVV
jgi:hypothetical protein